MSGRKLILITIAMGLYFCSPLLAKGTERLWQIGVFDESSQEFNQGLDPATDRSIDYADPAHDPVYIVGKSNPARDWLAFQPGSANGYAGNRPHPFTVQFDLSETPAGLFELKLALLVETARVPRLQVAINGHSGLFYQHPELNYTGGDIPNLFLPQYSANTLVIDLPTRFLMKGSNRLVLTALDEPAVRDDSQTPTQLGDSGVVYDALELLHDSESSYQTAAVTAQVIPTIFYRYRGGELVELVDVFVRFGMRPQHGEIGLTLHLPEGNEEFKKELAPGGDFGEEMVEFEVQRLSSNTKGELSIFSDHHKSNVPIELSPAKRWTLFVIPNMHLDVGFTDYQAKVGELHSRSVDEVMEMIRNHPEFRFTLDGSMIAQEFLAWRDKDDRQKFLELVKANKISVPSEYASLLTGFPTLETLIRSLYYGYRFNQEHEGQFSFANITDVPSYTWSYASVLAAAGLKYFVAGSDNIRGPILIRSRLHEKSPFWWEGPDGSRILTWYSRHYHQVYSLFGLPPQLAAGRDSLPLFLQAYTQPEYTSDAVLIFGSQVENTDLFPQQADMVAKWNSLYAYPKLQFSDIAEALNYIVAQQGDKLPVFRGDGGPYWEDTMTSDAYFTAIERANERRTLSAEKLSIISALVGSHFRADPNEFKRLWQNVLLFDEHTGEADGSIRQPGSQQSIRQEAVKEACATEGHLLVDDILERAMAQLADHIDDPSGSLVVLNPLNWQRSGLVETDLDDGLELWDLGSKKTVPFETLGTGKSFRHIRFIATDVPSLGYKCYLMRPGGGPPQPESGSPSYTMDSPYYRVVLDPGTGSVKSIFDKQLDRELVDSTSPYRFGQYIYVTGGDQQPNRIVQYLSSLPPPQLQVHGASGGRIIDVTREPFGMVAHLESSNVNAPRVETEIILNDQQKKIEIINHVEKTKVYTKEAAYFAFPLAMDQPQFRYEIQSGFVDPAKDLLPGAGREWFSVQNWVSASQGGVTATIVPVDAPLVTLGDIVRGNWPTEFGKRKGTIFSYVMDNYWFCNAKAGQGGVSLFATCLAVGASLNRWRSAV